jgi:hypothetical protein
MLYFLLFLSTKIHLERTAPFLRHDPHAIDKRLVPRVLGKNVNSFQRDSHLRPPHAIGASHDPSSFFAPR